MVAQEFPSNQLPKFDDIWNDVNWMRESRIVISPSLGILAYPSLEDDRPIVLWDIANQRELARIPHGDFYNSPKWSPDGTKLLTSAPPDYSDYGRRDLFVIDASGEIERLTYFAVNNPEFQGLYQWSPTGDQIVFLRRNKDSDPYTGVLTTLEVSSKKLIGFCVEFTGEPIWSPDGRFIALPNSELNSTQIVDVENSETWVLENAYLLGWMR